LKLTSRVEMKFTGNVKGLFETQLAGFFGIDVTRVDYQMMHRLNEGSTVHSMMVDFYLSEGAPTIDALYKQLTSELKEMTNSSLYGCKSSCSSFKSSLADGSVLQYVNPFYSPVLDAAFLVDAAPADESSATGFIVAGCIVAVVVLLAMVLFWRRHQKTKKFTENQLLSYQDSEPGYVAVGPSDVGRAN